MNVSTQEVPESRQEHPLKGMYDACSCDPEAPDMLWVEDRRRCERPRYECEDWSVLSWVAWLVAFGCSCAVIAMVIFM